MGRRRWVRTSGSEEALECKNAHRRPSLFCSLLHTFTKRPSYSSRCRSPYPPSLIMQTKKAPPSAVWIQAMLLLSSRCGAGTRQQIQLVELFCVTNYCFSFRWRLELCPGDSFGCDLSFIQLYFEVCKCCILLED